ncbi:MAG TPA: hypothetical protein VMU51_28495 [Mycobacteriales bacterium]|jgi:hypothetical protein|nr:hypothetical protein [Mycobacteriales bacterium]
MRVEAQVKTEAPATPILLTPTFVERMITRRQAVQIVRFRTTCTDCVPNM